MELGKLNQVDLRTVWKSEAHDFTRWLAREENLSLLSEEIGIEIRLIKTEADNGDFRVDILAEEENSGRKIIIENQLEETDHDHLGKLITYASGHNAQIIIWIVDDVREEHKRAIEWLNEHTDESTYFFLIKMELWQIGDSTPAPKFSIMVKPNEWAKTIKESANRPNESETKLKQLEFWNMFKDYAQKKTTKLSMRSTYAQHWYDISLGSSYAHISLTMNTQKNKIGCELHIPNSKKMFQMLLEKKEEIEQELGHSLSWMELPNKKASRIKLIRNAEINNKDNWEEIFNWFLMQAEKFHDVFQKYIEEIKMD